MIYIRSNFSMVVVSHDHIDTVFACTRCAKSGVGATGPYTMPPRDGPIVPSNCKTHLTCKPIHPNREGSWSGILASAGDWFTTVMLALGGTGLALGACIYGKSVIDKNRQRRRDARMEADGRRPPSDGESDEDNLRGERG